MVRVCNQKDYEELMDFLKQDIAMNTFLLADIYNFGFDCDFQTVYGDWEEDQLQGVYLRFYENLLFYSFNQQVHEGFLRGLFCDFMPAVVMGMAEGVKEISRLLPDYFFVKKDLYQLDQEEFLVKKQERFKVGRPGEERKIHDFLLSIDEIKGLYGSREIIENRLKTGDGKHYYLESEEEIYAHVNSSAQSKETVMIGGVAVAPSKRNQGCASYLVSEICRDILSKGKKPCLFSDYERSNNLFVELGFVKVGDFATLIKGNT